MAQYGENLSVFVDDSLPEGFPAIEAEVYDHPMQGYNFISPLKHGHHYLIICDNFATPVFYRSIQFGASDFKLQPNGMLSYFDNRDRCFYGLDDQFNVVDTFRCGNGYGPYTDMHELRLQENGHYFLLAYDPQLVNMDTVVVGGHPAAVVTGLIVQELDENDSVVFQWRSWDHFKITDAHSWVNLQDSVIDYVHGNSIEIESDTTLLISCRNMNEITKIDRRTGEIIWRLNGENNQFTFIDDTIRFVYQHSIRYMPDSNHISIFDNGLGHSPEPFSSALEYEINEENMTATLVERLHRDPNIFGAYMGHAQRHQNGWTTMGWGFVDTNHTHGYDYIPGITEFDQNGDVSLEISVPYNSYRAFKFDWVNKAIVPSKENVVFDSLEMNESRSDTVYIRNNTAEEMIINRILHHNEFFVCETAVPFVIGSIDSAAVCFSFHLDEIGTYQDLYTFCSDTYENDVQQRIACQVWVEGYAEESVIINNHYALSDLLEVHPNPATDHIYVSAEGYNINRLFIYSLSGEMLLQDEMEQQLIDVSSLKPGIYLLTAWMGNKMAVKKIIIQ